MIKFLRERKIMVRFFMLGISIHLIQVPDLYKTGKRKMKEA